jgi:hypothetical protein
MQVVARSTQQIDGISLEKAFIRTLQKEPVVSDNGSPRKLGRGIPIMIEYRLSGLVLLLLGSFCTEHFLLSGLDLLLLGSFCTEHFSTMISMFCHKLSTVLHKVIRLAAIMHFLTQIRRERIAIRRGYPFLLTEIAITMILTFHSIFVIDTRQPPLQSVLQIFE